MKKLLLSILFMVLTMQFANAQMPAIDLPLTVTDGAGGMQELRFGLDPAATDGIDATLGESELPPIPPAGVFDARFIGTDISIPLGQGIPKDYRAGDASFSGMQTHEISYQVGSGTAITISWDLPDGVTGVIQDLITGTLVNQAMTGTGNFTVPFPPTVISKLKMTITYTPVQQPLAAPTLASPADGAAGVSTSPALSWNPVSDAASYQLQVSTDPNFSTTVVDQSGITAASSQVSGLLNNTQYDWRVRASNAGGMSDWSPVWSFTTRMTTAVEQINDATPTAYHLNQNYPNPFKPSTRIRFSLPEAGEVRVAIYNLSGQLVKQLVAGEMNAGRYGLVWDATDARGARVASGVYLYQLRAGTFTQVRKMSLLR